MTKLRWIAFALALAGVFCLSAAAGALIARQNPSPTPPIVAVASPTPGVSATPAPSPTVLSPTAAPTSSPASTPTSAPATPSPVPPTASPAPTAALDPLTAEDFAAELLTALQTGDTTFLNERLHPEVLARYGSNQCRRRVNAFGPSPNSQWTYVSSGAPAPWSWETDGLATSIPDTTAVTVDEPGTGQRDLHFAPADTTWRWFLDCGTPR